MTVATLFDTIRKEGKLTSDAAMCRLLDIQPQHLCKMRKGITSVTGNTILTIYEETGMSIERIKGLLASDAVVVLPRRTHIRTVKKLRNAKPAPTKPASFVHRCM
jgi:hypothetical protein